MTTFYLIRHAEKASDPALLTGRSAGIHLTERGREQAQRIARHLAAIPLDLVVSSPLERAQETAAPLAESQGLTVAVSPALTEFDWGDWTQQTPDSLAGVQGWQPFNTFRSGTRIPGGETMLDVQTRVVGELLHLRSAWPQGKVALVSHGDPLKAAVLHFLGAPLDFWSRIEIGVGSVSVLTLSEHDAQVIALNHQP